MPRVAPNVPAETDLLCEACGYTLNGLPPDGNCPECGSPVVSSTAEDVRQPSAWEQDKRFFATTAEVIFRPSRFFRSTTSRGNLPLVQQFGDIQTAVASLLFAAAGTVHGQWLLTFQTGRQNSLLLDAIGFIALSIFIFISMTGITRLAARLTTLEATYRGIRLPLLVVRRGLAFHAAHYLPVGIVAVVTTAAYQILLARRPIYWSIHANAYLFVLSGEVILGASYLFHTYWIAMRKMMYANH